VKKFIVISVLSLFILAACSQGASVFNPIVGTWEITALGITTNEVYGSNATCSQTTTIAGVGVTKSGSWTSTSDTITRTWSASDSDTVYYSFNSDNSQLTVSTAPSGISTTFSRI
jgi:hypothetical protein